MSFSINTNTNAAAALQVLNRTRAMLEQTQLSITTGMDVNGPKDDPSTFQIAQRLRGDIAAYRVVHEAQHAAEAAIAASTAGGKEVMDLLLDMKARVVQYLNAGLSADQKKVIRDDFESLRAQIDTVVGNTDFNGTNLLKLPEITTASTDFTANTASLALTQTADLATADFNGDGNLDVVVSDIGGVPNLEIRFGNGDGTFSGSTVLNPGDVNAQDIVATDLNKDGRADIAVRTANALGVSVFIADSNGTFNTATLYQEDLGGTIEGLQAGDVDGDGFTDLIAIDNAGDVNSLVNNGDGTFTRATATSTGSATDKSLATGDFNGDGLLDIVVGNETSDDVKIMTGNGDGTFAAPTAIAVGDRPTGVDTGDINGDGRLDIVSHNVTDDTVSVLLGNGDGTFQAAVDTNVSNGDDGPDTIEIADINNDGFDDVIVSGFSDDAIDILAGSATGGLTLAGTLATGDGPSALHVADYTGDGNLDILAPNFFDGTLTALVSNGTIADGGRFSALSTITGSTIAVPNQPMSTAALGLGAIDLATNASTALAAVDAAIVTASQRLAGLGSSSARLEVHSQFIDTFIDILRQGLGNLVDADLADAAARNEALQIREQLGVQTLAIANSSKEMILQLFR